MEEEEDIYDDASEEERRGGLDLLLKAAEFSAVSENFDQHGSGGRYL